MKVYFDKSLLQGREWIPFLNPLLWTYSQKRKDYSGYYAPEQERERTEKGKNFLLFSSLEECDYLVFPLNFKFDYLPLLESQSALWAQYHKKMIVFFYNDCEISLPDKYHNLIIFRTSMTLNNPENEFCMPWFPQDLWQENGIWWDLDVAHRNIWYWWYGGYYNLQSFFVYLVHLIKNFIIHSTFIGHWILKWFSLLLQKYPKSLKKIAFFLWKKGIIKNPDYLYDTLYWQIFDHNRGKIVRWKIIKKIKEIWIPFVVIPKKQKLDPWTNNKQDYINTIKNCTFPLVMRGDGNYSYRLSEVMSLGKIPLFIDTHCRLPFDNQIDYQNLFIRVPFDDLKNIESYISQYLNHNKDHLQEIQKKIRNIYENYFILTAYYTKIIEQLMKDIS